MFYFLSFVFGLFIGAGTLFATYVIKTWLPIVRAAEATEATEKVAEQWDKLMAYGLKGDTDDQGY